MLMVLYINLEVCDFVFLFKLHGIFISVMKKETIMIRERSDFYIYERAHSNISLENWFQLLVKVTTKLNGFAVGRIFKAVWNVLQKFDVFNFELNNFILRWYYTVAEANKNQPLITISMLKTNVGEQGAIMISMWHLCEFAFKEIRRRIAYTNNKSASCIFRKLHK